MKHASKKYTGGLIILWPPIQYIIDWYREPGPMLPWGFLDRLIGGVWVWAVGAFGVWLVYDSLKRLRNG